MFNFKCFWPQSLLGLDIQENEIRLVQLEGFIKKKKIKQAVSCDLPLGAIVQGKIQEPESVSHCLEKLVRDNNITLQGAAIALPMNCLVTQHIPIDKRLNELEVEAEVVGHLNHYMPGITEGLFYDYVITHSIEGSPSDLFLVVTTSEHLDIPMQVVHNAGLQIRVVDVKEYAIERAIQFTKINELSIDEKWLVSVGLALRGVRSW